MGEINFSFRVTGLDELCQKFDEMSDEASDVCGEIAEESSDLLKNLLSSEFLSAHTDVDSLKAFFEKGGFDASSDEAIKAIPDDAMDKYVSECSDFESWREMLQAATNEYLMKKFDLE